MTDSENRGRAAKIAISLPAEQLAWLRAQDDDGGVSGRIQQLIRREQEAADVEATLARLFGDDQAPGADHTAWADRALGLTTGRAGEPGA